MPDPEQIDATDKALCYGALHGSLGFLLRLAQIRSFATFYKEIGVRGMRPGAFSVLMMIDDNPGIRQGVLARALSIKRAHMTKMVRGFEEAGLVRRTVPADDKRSVELWLTPAGRRSMSDLRAPFDLHETQSHTTLSADELEQLKRLLRRYLELPSQQDQP